MLCTCGGDGVVRLLDTSSHTEVISKREQQVFQWVPTTLATGPVKSYYTHSIYMYSQFLEPAQKQTLINLVHLRYT